MIKLIVSNFDGTLMPKLFDAKLTRINRDEARHGKALEGLLNRYFK